MKVLILICMCFLLIPAAPLTAQETEHKTGQDSGLEAAQQEQGKMAAQLTLEDLRTFTDVFNQLRRNSFMEVDDHTLLVAAIEGMVSSLDPWSAFLDTDQSRVLENTSRGRYGGIGVQVDLRNWRIVVEKVVPGGPADQAGVEPGDMVTAVDGVAVRERKVFESLDAMLGDPGSEVKVRFKRSGRPARDHVLVREFIPVSSVTGELLEHGIGYFGISHFHRNSHKDLEKAIDEIKGTLGTDLHGIILDLRGNPGGVVRPAVEIADGFLDEGIIVYTQGRYEAAQFEFRAQPGQWVKNVPLALLVDGRTASASEVLTGALQDHGRAIVLGEKTYGKGSIQSIFKLRNGSTLKLTTAHYFTPSGREIHENGIQPDIVGESRKGGPRFAVEPELDPLLREALNLLKLKTTTDGGQLN